jgi:hypothetical protein
MDMENQQSVQHSISHLNDPNSKQLKVRETMQRRRSNFLTELMRRHYPWLILSGVAAFSLAVTAISILSLIHIGRVEQEEPISTPVPAEDRTEKIFQPAHPMTSWFLGAVILSCTAGSLIIFKILNPPSSSEKGEISTRNRSSTRVLRRRQQRKRRLSQRATIPAVERSQPVAPSPAPLPAEAVITVLPPEKDRSLKRDNDDLAEMLDIRKKQPLSSILGNNYR